jgi:hypothetical protein
MSSCRIICIFLRAARGGDVVEKLDAGVAGVRDAELAVGGGEADLAEGFFRSGFAQSGELRGKMAVCGGESGAGGVGGAGGGLEMAGGVECIEVGGGMKGLW